MLPQAMETKPFDVLAEQYAMVRTCLKHAPTEKMRREMLMILRMIIAEADSLNAVPLRWLTRLT